MNGVRQRWNLTALAAIQALVPICLSSFRAERAFSTAISQARRDTVFFIATTNAAVWNKT